MKLNEQLLYSLIGKNIKVRRLELNFSQRVLAAKCSLSRTSISNIEKGRQKASLDVLYRISLALKVDVKSLLPTLKTIKKVEQGQKTEEKIFLGDLEGKLDDIENKSLKTINKLLEE